MRLATRVIAAAVAAAVSGGLWAIGSPAGAEEPGETTAPVVAAKAWLVVDVSSGAILAAKNPHRRLPPASTLKMLTAVTLLPLLDKAAEYRVRWEDAAVEGSRVGIVPGATYTVDDLFHGLLLPSGNDAAHALAGAAGGMHRTVALMQAEADRLGAIDTTVRNPSGLDAPGQLSSAYDLALIASAGLRREDFRTYVSTLTADFPAGMPRREGQERRSYQIANQNPLLITGYPGVVGVKTGYTTMAGRTFVGAAERDGHLLVVTMLGNAEATETAAARLLDWGFEHVDAEPVGYLVGAARAEDRVLARSSVTAAVGVDDATTSGADLGAGRLLLAALGLLGVVLMALGVRRLRRG